MYFTQIVSAEKAAERVTVFIIDSEIEEEYLHGKANINAETRHGSLVAWIIRQETKNYEINIIPLDVAYEKESIKYNLYLAALREIIDYKLTHPRQEILVNISLGFSERIGYDYIRELYDRGVQVVAAAGNDNSQGPVYPAGFSREVIAVASAGSKGKTENSNYGFYVDISAPGSLEYIESLYFPGQTLNRKFRYSGTSFATPRVTALLAVLLAGKNDLTVKKAIEIVEDTALPVNDKFYEEGMLGAGIINKEGALARILENYRLYKYLKISAIIFVMGFLLILLWQKYKIFSFFVFLLFLLVLFPFIVIIKENMYFLFTEGSNYLYYLAGGIILLFIIEKILILITERLHNPHLLIKLLTIPSPALREAAEGRLFSITDGDREKTRVLQQKLLKTIQEKKQKTLLRVLMQIENSPLEFILNYTVHNWYLTDFVAGEIVAGQNREELINILLKYLEKGSYSVQNMAERVCRKLHPGLILKELLFLLKKEEGSNKEIILRILASYGIKAVSAVEIVKKILRENEDMWTRYQAVRTLYRISIDKKGVLDYLEEYRDDEQELVRMEVRVLQANNK